MKHEHPSPKAHHCIKRLRVVGGFLDTTDIKFADGLNCIIGPRGTGKTTVLELLRFGLDAMPGREGDPLRRRIESLVEANLNGGRVEISVETKEGLSYTITRALGEEPIVLDENGKPVPGLKLKGGQVFTADIFSQNQIESIAETTHYQLDLLDKFREAELSNVEWEMVKIVQEAESNAATLLPLLAKSDGLKNDQNELPVIQAKLEGLRQAGGPNAEAIDRAHEDKSLRDQENRSIEEAERLLSELLLELRSCTGRLAKEVTDAFSEETLKGPNGALLKKMLDGLKLAAAESDGHVDRALDALRAGKKALATEKGTLEEAHKTQELAFQKLLEKHREAQAKSAERAKWEKKRNALMFKKRELAEVERQIADHTKQRDAILRKLSDKRDARFALRNQVAEELNRELSPNIRVRIQQYGDLSQYHEHLEGVFRGSGMKGGVAAGKVASAVSPRELAEMVKKNNPEDVAEKCNLNANQASTVLACLNKAEQLFALEIVGMDDAPSVELKVGTEYRDSSALSTGQKCTAILPILLFESANPLLVDQPEDNLDNRYVFKTVVENLRKLKGVRQLIFVTHNPNIPVLSDAAQVAVMTSEDQTAKVAKTGNVDECKDDIVTLLEGGEDAFKERKKRYHY